MGADEPLAVLSEKPQLLPSYFKQLFAQVTNPPIDSIREELVTATGTTLGAERNLLKAEPESCRHVELEQPLLDDAQLAQLKALDRPGLKAATLPILFAAARRQAGLAAALDDLFAAADAAHRRRRHPADPLRPRRRRGTGADPGAARRGRAAPPPDPQGDADPGRAGAGVGRAPRSPPVRRADRLRRRGDQSLPGPRIDRAADRRGAADRRRAGQGGRQLPQGRHQGGGQDHGQDGDLDHPVLPRRPDLRGHRPLPRAGGTLLHRHRQPHRRHRPARGSPRKC